MSDRLKGAFKRMSSSMNQSLRSLTGSRDQAPGHDPTGPCPAANPRVTPGQSEQGSARFSRRLLEKKAQKEPKKLGQNATPISSSRTAGPQCRPPGGTTPAPPPASTAGPQCRPPEGTTPAPPPATTAGLIGPQPHVYTPALPAATGRVSDTPAIGDLTGVTRIEPNTMDTACDPHRGQHVGDGHMTLNYTGEPLASEDVSLDDYAWEGSYGPEDPSRHSMDMDAVREEDLPLLQLETEELQSYRANLFNMSHDQLQWVCNQACAIQQRARALRLKHPLIHDFSIR